RTASPARATHASQLHTDRQLHTVSPLGVSQPREDGHSVLTLGGQFQPTAYMVGALTEVAPFCLMSWGNRTSDDGTRSERRTAKPHLSPSPIRRHPPRPPI